MMHRHAMAARLVGTNLPPKEPAEICEACGAQGTVGRALRTDDTGAPTEIHRFCAPCWPEQSARYLARWEEERRLIDEAWHRGDESAPIPSGGWAFESATWHGVLGLVRDIRRASLDLGGQSLAGLGKLAREMAAGAADRVGEMPHEVESFIRTYESDTSEEQPPDPASRRARNRAESAELMRDAELYSTAAIAALDDALKSDMTTAEHAILDRVEQCDDPRSVLTALERAIGELRPEIDELTNNVRADRDEAASWERRAMLAITEGRDDLAKLSLLRHGEHLQAAERLDAELNECLLLEQQYRTAILQLQRRLR